MAKLNLGLRHKDVDTTQRTGGGGALPDGFYRFEVDEVNDKPHFDNREGYKLDIVLLVTEPEDFKGRKIFLDCGVEDPTKPDFEQWGREALGRLLRAVDFPEDQEFNDTDDLVGREGIAKVGLDRKRSDSQNKRFSKLWGYAYPEDWTETELGPFARQEEWTAGRQSPEGEDRRSTHRRDDSRASRSSGSDRGGSRDDRGGSRGEDRGRGENRGGDRGRDDRGGRGERDDRGGSRGGDRDQRGNEDDDIPFDQRDGGGDDRPTRGGGSNPWNRGRR